MGFALKAALEPIIVLQRALKHLQSDRATDGDLDSFIDLAHTAVAEEALDEEATNSAANELIVLGLFARICHNAILASLRQVPTALERAGIWLFNPGTHPDASPATHNLATAKFCTGEACDKHSAVVWMGPKRAEISVDQTSTQRQYDVRPQLYSIQAFPWQLLLIFWASVLWACTDTPPARERPDLGLSTADDTTPPSDTPTETTDDAPTLPPTDTTTTEDPTPNDTNASDVDEDTTPPLPPGVWIATFNVERFFDTVCDTGQCGFQDYEPPVTEAGFNRDADRVAQGIERLGADIVLLQEVESQACIDAVAARLGSAYAVYALGESNTKASVDVAVVAKGELVKAVRHRQEILLRPDGGTTTFAREFYEVHLNIEGKQVIVFASHFVSKVGGDDSRRLAEATGARRIVVEVAGENPGALVVMGGDLNDFPGSPPINELERDGALVRVAADLGAAAGTYYYNDENQAIDHLFIAVGAAGGHYRGGTAGVMRYDGERGWGGSDHAALKAYFEFGAAP